MRLPRMKRRVTHYGWTQTIRRRMSVMVWIMVDPRDSWTIPVNQTVGFSRPHTIMPIPRYMTSHSLPPKLSQRGRNSHLTIRMRMIVVLSQMKKRTKYFCGMVTIQRVVSAGPAIAVVIFLIKKITLRCRTSGTSLVGIFWLRWARVRSKIGKLLHIRCPLRLSRLTSDAFTWGRRILTLSHVAPVQTALLFPYLLLSIMTSLLFETFSLAKGNVPSLPSAFFEMLLICVPLASLCHLFRWSFASPFSRENNFILISSGLLSAQGSQLGAISDLIGTRGRASSRVRAEPGTAIMTATTPASATEHMKIDGTAHIDQESD